MQYSAHAMQDCYTKVATPKYFDGFRLRQLTRQYANATS